MEDDDVELGPGRDIPTDGIPVNFVPAKTGEIIKLGVITCRVLEDGSRTDNRIGAAEFTLPPGLKGPPAHWHEMHDETFLTTKGTIRYHLPKADGTEDIIDAKEGDYVTVPVRAPHTFSNPTDQEAKFFNTYTPAYYINYFKLLGTYVQEGKPISPREHLDAMSNYATLPVPKKYQKTEKE
ncbi:RmlC-like cupin domain-containing protein [Ilyonectria sp. MPI-CAGE-AT-0026]|nr:RmlC-like cupin domain-containing protein [Ilyonectria sp. MPI-CAGE-AT-0026]